MDAVLWLPLNRFKPQPAQEHGIDGHDHRRGTHKDRVVLHR